MQTRQWEDKSGNKRETTEVVANAQDVILLGGGESRQAQPVQAQVQHKPEIDDSDIPF